MMPNKSSEAVPQTNTSYRSDSIICSRWSLALLQIQQNSRNNKSRAFTLVELLVVLAIIGLLVSIMLPAVQSVREAARRSQCTQNLGQLILAVHRYETGNGVYPPGTLDQEGPVLTEAEGFHHNWIEHILPYLDQGNAAAHIDWQVGVYHENNEPVRSKRFPFLVCPSAANRGPFSNYAGVHHHVEAPIDDDNLGVFFLNSQISYLDVSDGAANTLFVGEKFVTTPGDLGWMSGTRATLRNTGTPINRTPEILGELAPSQPEEVREVDDNSPAGDPNKVDDNSTVSPPNATDAPATARASIPSDTVGGFESKHTGNGANFVFGDGRVKFLHRGVTKKVLQQLGQRNDGTLINTTDY